MPFGVKVRHRQFEQIALPQSCIPGEPYEQPPIESPRELEGILLPLVSILLRQLPALAGIGSLEPIGRIKQLLNLFIPPSEVRRVGNFDAPDVRGAMLAETVLVDGVPQRQQVRPP